MKNIISKIGLLCLSAMLLLSVCACGGNNTDSDDKTENEVKWEDLTSEEYSTLEEFSAMLVENKALWSENKQAVMELKENESITAFFKKNTIALELAQKLYDANISTEDIYCLYETCCTETWWYNNIVVIDSTRKDGTTPFGKVDRTYYPLFLYNFKPEKSQVQEGVKKLFKNPDSVSITSEINFYYDADGAKKSYDNIGNDIKMLVCFTARAKGNTEYTVGNFSVEYDYPNDFSNIQQEDAIKDSIWRFSGTYTVYD